MKIDSLYNMPIEAIQRQFTQGQQNESSAGTGNFSDVLAQTISNMNAQEQKGNQLMADVLQGKSDQANQAMVELENASFQMGVAVKVRDSLIGIVNQVQSGQI